MIIIHVDSDYQMLSVKCVFIFLPTDISTCLVLDGTTIIMF